MDRTTYLLVKLAEECCEAAQRATKAVTFGINEVQPGQPYDNVARLMDELEDVRVIVEMLREEGALSLSPIDSDRFAAKRAKVEKFMRYSQDCGTLNR